jgi:SPX domain protein involved in polyphosphate accumulation
MKFGAHFQEAISSEWHSYYLDYDLLKNKLSKAEFDKVFTERDETEFVELLDSDLEKVKYFRYLD